MNCPECGTENTRVLDTFKGVIEQRQRRCVCGVVFKTVETVVKSSIKTPSVPTNPPPIPISRNISEPIGDRSELIPTGQTALSSSDPIRSGSDPLSDLRLDLFQGADPGRAKKAAKRQETEAFKVFYVAYPRKTARDAAWRMWGTVGAEKFAAEIMAALEWQKRDVFASCPFDRIPHPATWLHNGRWKDEKPPQSNGVHRDITRGYAPVSEGEFPSGEQEI